MGESSEIGQGRPDEEETGTLSSCTKEDCSGTKGAMGKGQGGEEDCLSPTWGCTHAIGMITIILCD